MRLWLRRVRARAFAAQAFGACRYDTVKGVTTAPCQACLAAGMHAARASLMAGMPAAVAAKGPPWPPAVAAVAAKAQASALAAAQAGCTSCTSTSVYIVCETPSVAADALCGDTSGARI